MSDSPVLPPSRSRLVVPLTVAGGLLMEGLDSTVIATSLPQMAKSLAVTPDYLSMAITSYLLSLAIFIPVSGWMADRYGARRVYCWAIAIFAISSAFCALSSTLGFLVAMRMLQGLGGAMMSPVARLILLRSFPKSEYLSATTYMTIPALIGPMAGPVVGGFITEYFSWHWIFLINIPLGIINILLVTKLVHEIPGRRTPPFDLPGFLMLGTGFASGQFGLECVGRHIVGMPAQIGLFVAAALALVMYARYAARQANPVLDPKLLSLPSFSVSVTWGGLARMGSGGTPFLLPLLFQVGFGFDPFHSGLLMLVSFIGAFFMRFGFKGLLRKRGLRGVLIANTVVMAGLLPGFVLFTATSNEWVLSAYLFLFGFLRSVQFMSLTMLSYEDMSADNLSKGSSAYTVGQRLSMSAGVATAAVVTSLSAAHGMVGAAHIHPAFVMGGILQLLALIGLWRLPADAGRDITG